MTTTGIIEGYEDGSFKPTEPVTRAQMAKMISVLMNGGDDVSALYANANKFTDMENANWAKGFVAYCVGKGIIAGRSATVFDPSANVTATEAAKMLLVALGYDADIEGYVGATWKVNVQSDAKDNDLYDDLSISDYDAPLNRESAAQLIFNAMQATTKDYDKKSTVTVGDVVINNNTKAEDQKVGNAKNVAGTAYIDSASDVDHTAYVPLFAKAFDGDLKKNTLAGDDFGRPAHEWKFDNGSDIVTLGDYADTADNMFVSDDDYDNIEKFIEDVDSDLNKDIKDGVVTAQKVFLNGDNGGEGAYYTYGTTQPLAIKVGDTVEIFETTTNVYTISVERYVAAKITDVDTDVKKADQPDTKAYITIETKEEAGVVNDPNPIKDDKFVGYDANTYVEDAYIAVALNGNTVCGSYLLEKAATAEVTRVSGSKVVAGETYTKAYGWGPLDAEAVKTENSYDIYLDKNGYLIGTELNEDNSSKNYAVLTGIKENEDDYDSTKKNYQLRLLTADGKVTTYNVKDDNTIEAEVLAALRLIPTLDKTKMAVSSAVNASFKSEVGDANATLVKYTLNGDGEIKAVEQPNKEFSLVAGDDSSVSKSGTLEGTKLSKDVVGFYYDDDEWKAYTYSQLLEKDIAADSQMIGDGDAVLMLLTADAAASDDIFGVIKKVSDYGEDSDGYKWEVTMLVDGAEKVYLTKGITKAQKDGGADETYEYLKAAKAGLDRSIYFAKVKLNKDNAIDKIATASGTYNATYAFYINEDGANKPVSKFGSDNDKHNYDGVIYVDNNDFVTAGDTDLQKVTSAVMITEVSGSSIIAGQTNTSYVSLTDAHIYRVKADEDGNIDEIVNYSGSLAKGGYVILLQTDEDSDGWDTVFYITKADAATFKLGVA